MGLSVEDFLGGKFKGAFLRPNGESKVKLEFGRFFTQGLFNGTLHDGSGCSGVVGIVKGNRIAINEIYLDIDRSMKATINAKPTQIFYSGKITKDEKKKTININGNYVISDKENSHEGKFELIKYLK
ncbi:MAG TPA: hypothetical protein ENH46_07215 [Candidatus Pacearchaeota archaeon]|nr:hypothetical protein [Candidatus Pacearchaeota archaeon]